VRWRTQKFFHLSYYNEANGLYHTGIDDLSFVAFWVVVFTGLRAGVMDYILHPLASLGGIKKARTKVRFVEQAWLLVYYSFYVPLGMVRLSSLVHCGCHNVHQQALTMRILTIA
jgi:acyl-CoA-dependent ceramide synthase